MFRHVFRDRDLEFVRLIYRRCLQREPEAEGGQHFLNKIRRGEWNWETALSLVMASPEHAMVNGLGSPARLPSPHPLPRVCFLHIEKTAGTSFHEYLMELFPLEAVLPERLRELHKYSDEEIRRCHLFSGHFDLCSCSRLPAETRYVVFLRDPVERILSLYYFWRSVRQDSGNQHWEHIRIAKTCRLSEFLRHAFIQDHVDNVFVRRLLPGGVDPGKPVTADSAEQAGRILDGFTVVGLKELYSLSVLLFATSLGFNLPTQHYQRMSAEEIREHPNHEPVERESVTAEVAERLSELTKWDNVLYRQGVAKMAAAFRESFGFGIPRAQLPEPTILEPAIAASN